MLPAAFKCKCLVLHTLCVRWEQIRDGQGQQHGASKVYLGHAGQRCLDCLWRGQRMVMLTVQDVPPSLKQEQWHLAGLATSDDAALAVVMTVSVTSAAGAAAPVQAQHPAHWSLQVQGVAAQLSRAELDTAKYDSLENCLE